jgi:nitroreductase
MSCYVSPDRRLEGGDMDVLEALRTLLAVRRYQGGKAVPEATVQKILEAGRLTGSAMNAQPWHFVVVQDRDTLRQLGRLIRSGPYVAEAPLAVVVAVDKSSTYALSDASRAIQSMMLAAWADGVGSNWVGFRGMDEVRTLLKIPAALDVVAVVPFGYPAQPVGQGRKQRKPLRDIAHRERYGQPFA